MENNEDKVQEIKLIKTENKVSMDINQYIQEDEYHDSSYKDHNPQNDKAQTEKSDIEVSINLDKFIVQKKIGSGSFGKVYQIKDKITGEILASKVSIKELDEFDDDMIINISREINIISKLNHPSILKFIGFSLYDFKNKSRPVIITEYASKGALSEYIQGSKLNDTLKLILIYGIASAMSYLHSHNIIHRDLKPSNILLDDFLFPKIADFGLSKVKLQKHDNFNLQSANSLKGTPMYISPEIWERFEYSKAADVYAFGIIVYEIVTEEVPFPNVHFFDFPIKVKNGYRPEFKKLIPKSYQNLIEHCWSQEPSNRPTFDDILKQLREDKEFITESCKVIEYQCYINYIDQYQKSFDSSESKIIFQKNFLSESSKVIEKFNSKTVKNIADFSSIIKNVISFRFYNSLSENCKELINESYKDPQKQFLIGLSLIEGRNDFPIH